MTTEKNVKTPEVFVEFEKVISELLIKMGDYARINDDGTRAQALKAIEDVYSLFYSVVERASYMQETIRLMHQIEDQISGRNNL